MKSSDLLTACFHSTALSIVTSTPQAYKTWDDSTQESLFEEAQRELVLPTLRTRMTEAGLCSLMSQEAVEFLAGVEAMNLERNQAILAEVKLVLTLLNRAGIEPVLLKGLAYYAAGVYPNLAIRYLMDVDLLVPKSQLPAAVEILEQNDFKWDQKDRLGRFRHHHPPLRRRDEVSFELHHSLGMGSCEAVLPAAEVLSCSSYCEFNGMRVRVPCPEHLMTHLVMHSQIQHHYSERIWPPLRAMYDLVLLCQRFSNELNWRAVEDRFQKTGQHGTLTLHFAQVRDVLGLEPPFPIRLSGLTHIRWIRRKFLRGHPAIRFLDPVYLSSTVLVLRWRVLRSALRVSRGWR